MELNGDCTVNYNKLNGFNRIQNQPKMENLKEIKLL